MVKIRITIFVTLTTALGYILAANTISFDIIYTITGIFLLACGASALNQFQERFYDSVMPRTQSRPIPSGRIASGGALVISFFCVLSGVIVLMSGSNTGALVTGLVTFLWYNFFYTPLKRKSSLAIIPGSVVGALPPIAGWLAAGGSLTDTTAILLFAYFFVWQIPHFWILLFLYSQDYREAGYPVLTDKLTNAQLVNYTRMLMVLTVLCASLFMIFGVAQTLTADIGITLASLWMLYYSFKFSDIDKKSTIGAFVKINVYTLALIVILSIDKLASL